MSRWLVLSLAITVLAAAGAVCVYHAAYDRLKPEIAIHWDWSFQPDQTVPRAEALPYLLLFPGLMAAIILLTVALPWISPRQFSVEPFRRVWDYVMALLVILFAYLFIVQIASNLEGGPETGRLFLSGMFLFFALLGNVLGKVQRNFWMGVRTPWTLASDTVWNRTHRLTAWLWFAFGLIGFAAVLLGIPPAWCFIGLILVALIPVVYSLVLYKRLERAGKV